ncbi:MAG: helix-turn-helix transcriptional regulator [Oligoflexia bacterium]|nr:helix-turn-helix transcriptional regulator [Oligoflexia bacterium]
MESSTQNTHSKTQGLSLDDHLKRQVAEDISAHLKQFRDPKKGIRIIASQMGIHEKTLKRLIEGQNKPGYQTLFKIYRVLLKTTDDSKILKQVPVIVSDYLTKNLPKSLEEGVRYELNVDIELRKDPVFCEIYLLAGTGSVTLEYITFHYGRYGEKVVEKMLQQEILVTLNSKAKNQKNTYILGPNQANLSPESIKQMGIHIVDRFGKPELADELGNNYQGFYADGLTPEAYQEWIKIDQEAFRKKAALASDPKNKGTLKAYTYQSTDTLLENRTGLKQ